MARDTQKGGRSRGKAFGEALGRRTGKSQGRPGKTPVEQQERRSTEVEASRHSQIAVTGPGAADLLTAAGGMDRPESGPGKGMGQTRGEGVTSDAKRLTPRLGPDTEAYPGERHPEEQMSGSQTGTIGGGGLDAHNPSPTRTTGPDDATGRSSDANAPEDRGGQETGPQAPQPTAPTAAPTAGARPRQPPIEPAT